MVIRFIFKKDLEIVTSSIYFKMNSKLCTTQPIKATVSEAVRITSASTERKIISRGIELKLS